MKTKVKNVTNEKILVNTHKFRGVVEQRWVAPGEVIELENVNNRERYLDAALKKGLVEVKEVKGESSRSYRKVRKG